MKANETPEKLYLSKNIYSTYLYQVPDPDDETAVEYTRTDAFIENTCEWIKMMWSETDDRFKEDYTGMLIDNFKNYIKGE